jgi:hypothetical protein
MGEIEQFEQVTFELVKVKRIIVEGIIYNLMHKTGNKYGQTA